MNEVVTNVDVFSPSMVLMVFSEGYSGLIIAEECCGREGDWEELSDE